MITHRVHIGYPDENERYYWQCSCGRSGSAHEYDVDLKSDNHIDYDNGDQRIDTNKPLDNWW